MYHVSRERSLVILWTLREKQQPILSTQQHKETLPQRHPERCWTETTDNSASGAIVTRTLPARLMAIDQRC